MDDEKLIAALRLRVKANAEYDVFVGRKPLKTTLDGQAADRLLSLREENARLRKERDALQDRVYSAESMADDLNLLD